MTTVLQVSDRPDIYSLLAPPRQTVPLVFASPHSGHHYPADFLAQSRLDPHTLRRSEDSLVDQLYESAPLRGAPLLSACFPRAYCDANREALELDPQMFAGKLPPGSNTRSPRVAAGLGTIAKVVANGAEIYRSKLPVSEIEWRLSQYYHPYHHRLQALLDETRRCFGHYVLIDCHSMPSIGGPMDRDQGHCRVDMVLGDCYGSSCAAAITQQVEHSLSKRGYRVIRNTPYAGGYTTRHYGQPHRQGHALQIEINRCLYMNEQTHAPTGHFPDLQRDLDAMIGELAALVAGQGWA